MIEAIRAIPPADRAAAIDATARTFSRRAHVIEAAGLALFIAGWLAVWVATPGNHEIGSRTPRQPRPATDFRLTSNSPVAGSPLHRSGQ